MTTSQDDKLVAASDVERQLRRRARSAAAVRSALRRSHDFLSRPPSPLAGHFLSSFSFLLFQCCRLRDHATLYLHFRSTVFVSLLLGMFLRPSTAPISGKGVGSLSVLQQAFSLVAWLASCESPSRERRRSISTRVSFFSALQPRCLLAPPCLLSPSM